MRCGGFPVGEAAPVPKVTHRPGLREAASGPRDGVRGLEEIRGSEHPQGPRAGPRLRTRVPGVSSHLIFCEGHSCVYCFGAMKSAMPASSLHAPRSRILETPGPQPWSHRPARRPPRLCPKNTLSIGGAPSVPPTVTSGPRDLDTAAEWGWGGVGVGTYF